MHPATVDPASATLTDAEIVRRGAPRLNLDRAHGAA